MRSHLALILLVLGSCAPPSSSGEGTAVRAIVEAQLARHPEMGPEDLYKLLHQAAMGSEHAMHDTAGVRAWMVNELATMGQGPAEPMIDTIAPGGAIVRMNLRPWVAAGRSTDSLLAAFVATATAYPPDTARLARYLAAADTIVAGGKASFGLSAWHDLVAAKRAAGFPAGEHSPAYVAAYRPAYRIVAGALVP